MALEYPNAVVPVSVTVEMKSDGTVDIQCSPNPVQVDGCHTLIAFQMESRGWRFRTTNAVQVDKNHPEFPFPSWTVTPAMCTILDLCNTHTLIKYTINVVNTLNDAEYSLDPIIKNGDGVGNGDDKR
jgi:hypothetical protein